VLHRNKRIDLAPPGIKYEFLCGGMLCPCI
jgi:hypothetical protein